MGQYNTGAIPTVKMADVYGGFNNTVAPAAGNNTGSIQNGTDDGTTKKAQYWLLGMVALLVVLRLAYEKA